MERILLHVAQGLHRIGRIARGEEVVDDHQPFRHHDPVGQFELGIDRGAGVFAVDVHPAHGLVHRLEIEAARQSARWTRQRDHVLRAGVDRGEGRSDRGLVEFEIAEIELLVRLAVRGEERRRAALPDADFEHVALRRHLVVEQAAPQRIGMEAEPARNGVDLFPTQHGRLHIAALLTVLLRRRKPSHLAFEASL